MSALLPRRVRIVEVGPRDGLQNEPRPIATGEKIRFIDLLSAAGFEEIEITSFVASGRIPQLADAEAVARGIAPRAGCRYTALVPNEQGLERAVAAGIRRIAVFTAASETFNMRNIRATIDASIARFRPVATAAIREGISIRGYVSTAFHCPFEGAIDPARVAEVVRALLDLGVEEVSIGDTIGAAVPAEIERLLDALSAVLPLERTALHLHDTRGTGLANCYAGLLRGVSIFDASAGGLGGCPYAPGATGNLATEDLLYLLDRLGIETGVDAAALRRASDAIEAALGAPLASKVRRAGVQAGSASRVQAP